MLLMKSKSNRKKNLLKQKSHLPKNFTNRGPLRKCSIYGKVVLTISLISGYSVTSHLNEYITYYCNHIL